jgi:PAS domain S-box-containing protein
MTGLERFLAYSESHRAILRWIAGALVIAIAWLDWLSPETSLGYLYFAPMLLAAAALERLQILALAVVCAYLRQAFETPVAERLWGAALWASLDPIPMVLHSYGRVSVAIAAFAMTGLFVAEMDNRRRLLAAHLKEREEQIRRRREAEMQVRILIETSPLAILTLDPAGRILLANESAARLLGFDEGDPRGEPVQPYLPILGRILKSHRSGVDLRTSVECRGQRRNGEVFLAHIWFSTFGTSDGAGMAAVVWDSSENLRDREGPKLDAMMATSRVVIGAFSHEIRNLAAAASAALAGCGETARSEPYQALGSLIRGLETIASSGLLAASGRERVVADLGAVLDEARIVMEPSLRESGIATRWDVAGGLPLVQADHHSLLQVFLNLARNSRQALETCGRRELRISAAPENDLIAVRFLDSGPGVARPEELFRPFQQGAHSTGLGLYISRAILRSYGGGLRYEPRENGSCFVVELWPEESAGANR